jgi:hypothetical protein
MEANMDPQNPQTNPTPPPYNPQPQNPQSQDDHGYKGEYARPKEKGVHAMVVLQPGEQIVATVKRHPFGIIQLYAVALFGIGIAAVVAFLLAPSMLDQYHRQYHANHPKQPVRPPSVAAEHGKSGRRYRKPGWHHPAHVQFWHAQGRDSR